MSAKVSLRSKLKSLFSHGAGCSCAAAPTFAKARARFMSASERGDEPACDAALRDLDTAMHAHQGGTEGAA